MDESQIENNTKVTSSASNEEFDGFEFDPRATRSNAKASSMESNAEMDLLSAFSDVFDPNLPSPVSVNRGRSLEPEQPTQYDSGSNSLPMQSLSVTLYQPGENPFEDSPFVAVSLQDNVDSQPHHVASMTSSHSQAYESIGLEPLQLANAMVETVPAFDLNGKYQGYAPVVAGVRLLPMPAMQTPFSADVSGDSFFTFQSEEIDLSTSFQHPSSTSVSETHPIPALKLETVPQLNFEDTFQDLICAPVVTNSQFDPTPTPPLNVSDVSLEPQLSAPAKPETVPAYGFGNTCQGFIYAPGAVSNVQIHPDTSIYPSSTVILSENNPREWNDNLVPMTIQTPGKAAEKKHHQMAAEKVEIATACDSGNAFQSKCCLTNGNGIQIPHTKPQACTQDLSGAEERTRNLVTIFPESGLANLSASQVAVTLTSINQEQAPKDDFQPKSAVWAETLRRGLVNFNISGPKANPLADIGVDFDDIKRKEKRGEKKPASPVASTVTMGKAMVAGSSIGHANATVLRPSNSNVSSCVNMDMDGVTRMGMDGSLVMVNAVGMGTTMGFGGMNPFTMHLGDCGEGFNQTLSMTTGMTQGAKMYGAAGMPPPSMLGPLGGYNTMTSMGGIASQEPYGGHG